MRVSKTGAAWLVFALLCASVLVVLLARSPADRVDPDLESVPLDEVTHAPELVRATTAPLLRGGVNAYTSSGVQPMAAISRNASANDGLLVALREVARQSGLPMDYTAAHAAVFEHVRAAQKTYRNELGPLLGRTLRSGDQRKSDTVHLVLSALEGQVPLSRLDGAALASHLTQDALGEPAFNTRALLALAGTARKRKPIVNLVFQLLLKPLPDAGLIQAVDALAAEYEGLLDVIRKRLFVQRSSLGAVRHTLALVLTEASALRALAERGVDPSADAAGLRAAIVEGLADPHPEVRMLAATTLLDQRLIDPVQLWPVVSEALQGGPRMRTVAARIVGATAPTDEDLLEAIEKLWQTSRTQRLGVRLAMQYRARFASEIERRLRALTPELRRQFVRSVHHEGADHLAAGHYFARLLLNDPEPTVRITAVHQFARHKALRDVIENMTRDIDPSVAAAATMQIKKLDDE